MRYNQWLFRLAYLSVVVCAVAVTLGIGFLLQTKQFVYIEVAGPERDEPTNAFPVSVNPQTKTIEDIQVVDTYYQTLIAQEESFQPSLLNQATAFLAAFDWYQNLASPVTRIIVVWPGERKEEIAKNVGDVLRWSRDERLEFIELMDELPPYFSEGAYMPGKYVSHRYATPSDIALMLNAEFEEYVLSRYTPEVASKVPLEDAMIIASLIEREASDFENMREVSGVIWNRLFIDMPLQLDATLQYVRGSNPYEPRWWPAPRSRDKFLDSPYNTYANAGLPPGPIANPSPEAILAALNPVITECIFYFHAEDKSYHCSATYEEHVAKLRAMYGRGR